jgi:hypothetical protein
MIFTITCRERKEHRVFDLLLQMVPGLEGRLLNGSDEEVGHVAELVSAFNLLLICSEVLIDSRFRRVFAAPGPMTRKG